MNSAGAYKVSPFSRSGKPLVDGVLDGLRWSASTVTYSFPDSQDDFASGYPNIFPPYFVEAPDSVKAAACSVLDADDGNSFNDGFSIEGLTDLNIEVGAHENAIVRISMVAPKAGPFGGKSGGIDKGGSRIEDDGDVWVKQYFDDPIQGDRNYYTLMHEIGHSLGLKHGHVNGARFPDLPWDKDGMDYSVMVYDPSHVWYLGRSVDYPQTYMMADIAAMQFMYGADFTTNAGDTVYSWQPGSGATMINGNVAIADHPQRHFVWATIWDGGGEDTYDFSAFETDGYLSARAGDFSSFTTKPFFYVKPDGVWVYGTRNIANAMRFEGSTESLIENIVAGSGDDMIVGNRADNALTGGAGADTFVFYKMWGTDRVTDFADGSDMIQFMWESVTAEEILSSAVYANGNTKILFGDEKIVLENFDAANLDEADFVFGAAS